MAAAMCVTLSASAATPMDIQRALVVEANQRQVPVSLALAVAKVESGFNAGALSPVGARGVMQIMPATAWGEFGVEADRLWDSDLNVQLGVQYLKRLHDLYGGRWDLALSHYNGGTVKGDTPSSYTVEYVLAVQAWQDHYQQRGCDRLTAKRIVTHADSVALCLQGDGPIRTASMKSEPEPPAPMAAPQTPVAKTDLVKPVAPPAAKPQTETLKAQIEALKGPPAEMTKGPLLEEPEPQPEAAKAAVIAAPEPAPVPSPQPKARAKVVATTAQPWQPTPAPAETVTVVELPTYTPAQPIYGRPRRPGFARGLVAFGGRAMVMGPRGRRGW